MFVRNGEKLGSIKVDDDPSDSPKKAAKKAPAKKADSKSADESKSAESDVQFKSALDEPEQDARPNKSDLKADWVDYAVRQGMDRDEAEDATKEELVDKYGGD